MEENDSRFVAGHMGVDGDDVDAGLPQRLKCRPQFVFGDGEVAINHGVLVTTGKCRPSIHPHCIIQIYAVDLSWTSEGELDHSLVRFTAGMKDLV